MLNLSDSLRAQDFKDDHVKIRINQIQQKETVRLLPNSVNVILRS